MRVHWDRVAAVAATTALLSSIGAWMFVLASEPTPPSSQPTELVPYLPPCAEEDSDNCVWDAEAQGNGEGVSFVSLNGHVYYNEAWRDWVELNGGMYPALVDGYGPAGDTILYCVAPLTVEIDLDDAGNEWAGCM